MENNHKINFDVCKNWEVSNTQNNFYIFSVKKEYITL